MNTIQTEFPAAKPRTQDFKDVATCGDYSVPITSDHHRRHMLMNGFTIEHVYRGCTVAEITCDVAGAGQQVDDERFRFKGLTGTHSLQRNCTDADRLAAHWKNFTASNRERHDNDMA